MLEVAGFSEAMVTTYKTSWCHNPEDHRLNNKLISLDR
jgi:hypothetical protein